MSIAAAQRDDTPVQMTPDVTLGYIKQEEIICCGKYLRKN